MRPAVLAAIWRAIRRGSSSPSSAGANSPPRTPRPSRSTATTMAHPAGRIPSVSSRWPARCRSGSRYRSRCGRWRACSEPTHMTEALPTRDTGLMFDGDNVVGRIPPVHNLKTFFKLRDLAVDSFRRAGRRVLARRRAPRTWHEVGTARFGCDPATSVVDPNCQVHGIEGLFVVDASVLPSAGAVNTTLTIIALALRAGDHIARGVTGMISADHEAPRPAR